MRILVDQNVTGALSAFARFGDVAIFDGRTITRNDLEDADAIVVRSVTRVDAALLENTSVRFVGTATIGTDHLDLDYLRSRNIEVADAAGSNARSVAEYVVASLLELRSRGELAIESQSIAIIGVGRIGAMVAGFARALGMIAVEYDPPRERIEPSFKSATLSDVLACDVITLHVPLTRAITDSTFHLIDGAFIERMRSVTLLINTSRGGVVDRVAMTAALLEGRMRHPVVDVWEGEPDVPRELIDRTAIATPHIAGYSHDGKVRATEMMTHALARFMFNTSIDEQTGESIDGVASGANAQTAEPAQLTIELDNSMLPLDCARAAVLNAYDISRDDAALRAVVDFSDELRRERFDALRRDYRGRREFPAYRVRGASPEAMAMLNALGFI